VRALYCYWHYLCKFERERARAKERGESSLCVLNGHVRALPCVCVLAREKGEQDKVVCTSETIFRDTERKKRLCVCVR